MPEPSPYILSKCLSQLTGRQVAFVQTTFAVDGKIRQAYGVYDFLPHESAIVVKADLALLGSLGGALVGFPDMTVKEQLKNNPIEEILRDAISEVLNIVAAAITLEGRAVFSHFVLDPSYLETKAAKVLKEPFHRSYFTVKVDGYQGGRFAILAPFVQSKLLIKK